MAQSTQTSVMIVDDHPMVRQSLAFALRSVADLVFVGESCNGLEAVRLCQTLKPDLILMDWMMPVMDGIAATRLIHAQHPGVKIIVLTSYLCDANAQERVREAGGSLCLDKQTTMIALFEAIRQTMHERTVIVEGLNVENS